MPKQPAKRPGLNLATCTYQEFRPVMGHPVRTTVGYPRFRLSYQLAGHASTLTPERSMLGLPRDAYEFQYRRRLNAHGVSTVRAELESIAARHEPGRPLVLLCFDKLSEPGAWCHRTMFAAWWAERTGQEVPELGAVLAAPPAPPAPGLFDLDQ